MQKIFPVLALLVSAQAAFAQSPAPSSASVASFPQSASATPAPAAAGYRSAFADYRPYREPQPGSWRESNESARVLGGHRGQIGPEAPDSPTVPTASASEPARSAPAPVPHRH